VPSENGCPAGGSSPYCSWHRDRLWRLPVPVCAQCGDEVHQEGRTVPATEGV